MLHDDTRAIAVHQANQALRAPAPRFQPDAIAHGMRIGAVESGHLDATFGELNFRQLFPSLDRGVYCAHHAVGRPSTQLQPALRQHFTVLEQFGMGAFEHGWELLADRFGERIRSLLGQRGGGVLHVQSFSDGLSALLFAGLRGSLLCGEDHFTSARYLHARYGQQQRATVLELAGDAEQWVATEAYIDALTPDTGIVSLSTAHWRTGQVHDLAALTEAMARVCPEAVLLLDVYQTLGTAAVDVGSLPVYVAMLGGGVKQLHTGVGCGFLWASDALLAALTPNRSGWFAHAEPFAFSADFVPAAGAERFQTGVPNYTAMAAFLAETDVLLALGADPLPRIHERIANTRTLAVDAARAWGLSVVGTPEAAFLAIRTEAGPETLARLGSEGIVCDFRPDAPEATSGLLRLSTSASGFAYELLYALERLRNA